MEDRDPIMLEAINEIRDAVFEIRYDLAEICFGVVTFLNQVLCRHRNFSPYWKSFRGKVFGVWCSNCDKPLTWWTEPDYNTRIVYIVVDYRRNRRSEPLHMHSLVREESELE